MESVWKLQVIIVITTVKLRHLSKWRVMEETFLFQCTITLACQALDMTRNIVGGRMRVNRIYQPAKKPKLADIVDPIWYADLLY